MTFLQIPDGKRSPEGEFEGGIPQGGPAATGEAATALSARHAFLLRRFVDFAAQSMVARPFHDLLTHYLALLRPLAITHASLVDLSRTTPNPAAGLFFTTFPVETVSRFAKGSRWLDDPVWVSAQRCERPERWSDIVASTRGRAEFREVFYLVEGFADGLTIPIETPALDRPVMFLGAMHPIVVDDTIVEMLRVASGMLAIRVPRRDDRDGPAQRLTERERLVLTQTALGKGAREIGNGFEMSEKTVARHLLNIRGKLNASNTVQAVVIAIGQNLIQIR